MKRSWIKRGKKGLRRTQLNRGSMGLKRSRLKSQGKRGSLFPHRRHPKFMRWMLVKLKEGPRECDGCGRWRWTVRCHLDAKGNGGWDLGNVVLMCDGPGDTCHRKQEKRTDAFISESGRDVYEIAREYEREFLARGDS